MSEASQDIHSVAKFDVYETRLPENVDRHLADALGSVTDRMRADVPATVVWIVLWPARPWKYSVREVILYTLSSSSTRYEVIKGLASLLAPVLARLLIIPTIAP